MTGKKSGVAMLMLFASLMGLQAKPQERVFKFWVELKDKTGTTYSILKPWDFLSERALERRRKAGISVTYDDLPVSPAYLKDMKACGVKVLLTSRWMNAALIETSDSMLVHQVTQQTYVQKVTLMGFWNKSRSAAAEVPDAFEDYSALDYNTSGHIAVKNKANPEEYNSGYGLAWSQTKLLNLQKLHEKGFKGQGIWIAVLDAGFYRANELGAFDSLRVNKRILGSRDFVDLDKNVYNDDDHGTQVLSCMAANVPGIMVGSAPEASYLLIRTEDARSEYPVEEAQWLAGAEYADSVGVDMINSSLGYTEFDREQFGHTYSELNGHTALITLAANMAYDRGILIVNSAGNEGDERWEKMGAPADAMGVLAIAATDADGVRASFSSMGPTYDGRVKPDLAAMGKRAIISGTSGYFYGSNGTSYSAPILTGALACLMQSDRTKTAAGLRQVVMASASNYLQPDTLLGAGIPDMELAWKILTTKKENASAENPFFTWPSKDTLNHDLEIKTTIHPKVKYTYRLLDGSDVIASGIVARQEDLIYDVRVRFVKSGWYFLEVTDGDTKWVKKLFFDPVKEE